MKNKIISRCVKAFLLVLYVFQTICLIQKIATDFCVLQRIVHGQRVFAVL